MSHLIGEWGVIKGSVPHTPTFRNRIYQLLATLRFRGLGAGIVDYYDRLRRKVTKQGQSHGGQEPNIGDERFAAGDGARRLDDLAIESPSAKWGLPYEPTHPGLLDSAVQSLPIRHGMYSFIDFGAGKGLALLLAAKYPFKSIIGVEYSKTLAEVADRNIRTYKDEPGSHASIQCIRADASDFELPHAPTVLYLFNPFQGKVMDRVIANIEESLRTAPRDLWVIYENPWEGRKFRRSPLFETIEWNLEYSIHRSLSR
jgi:hypothetical protein